MRRRGTPGLRTATLFVLAFSLGCGDEASAPKTPPIVPDGQFHPVRFDGSAGEPAQFAMRRGPVRPGMTAGAIATNAAGLSFWAHTDRDAAVSITRIGMDGTSQPYVTLSIPRGSLFRRPDGSEFQSRDSVEITVTVDQHELNVELQPSGLLFNPLVPAQLTVSYQGADPDLDGDGSLTSVDDYIGQVLLGLRTQQKQNDPWEPLPSTNDVVSKALSADLRHFTGYAVSW